MANAKKTAGKTAKQETKPASNKFASIFTGMSEDEAKTAFSDIKAAYDSHVKMLKSRNKEVNRMQKRADKMEIVQISLADKKAIKKMKFKFVDYSEKCFVLSTNADTKCLMVAFKKLGGKWNGRLKNCGGGSYVFSKEKSLAQVQRELSGCFS